MVKSQNEWVAGTSKAIGGLDTSYVPGTRIKLPRGVRKGDVATVLLYVAQQFHRTVEPLQRGRCWGYDYRKIRGSADRLSNHASGTAIDLNAPSHPLGRSGTFSAKEVAAIRRILDFCDGTVRWGGDYHDRKDEMHFEIVKGAGEVALVAKKIRAHSGPVPVKGPKIIVDGVLGVATIKRWQRVMGVAADGRLKEPSALTAAVQRHLNEHGHRLTVDGEGLARNGSVTRTVTALQQHLGVAVTGKLTPGKSATVAALQKRLNKGRF